ncbi:hypothetical protein D3C75_1105670 [compost metagenome]
MAEAFGFFLPDVVNFNLRRTLNLFQQLQLAVFQQSRLQLKSVVEVILDRPFTFTCNNDDILDTGSDRFFHDVLNSGLVDDRQHFLRHCFRGRKEARS